MTESITTLNVSEVYPNPRHYREVKPEAVKTLAESIKAVGQIEPISVFRDGEVYIIDSGHHRHAAAVLLGLDTIKAIVNDENSASLMVGANMHFEESELEKSRGTQLLLQTGVRPEAAAAITGDDPERMTSAKRVLDHLGPKRMDYAEDMTLDRLVALSDFIDDPEAEEKLLKCSEDTWKRVHADMVKARNLEAAYAEAVEFITAAGVGIIEDSQGLRFLGSGPIVPEGATSARISRNEWSGTVNIYWHGEAVEDDIDAEAEAQKAQAAMLAEQIDAAGTVRIGFVRAYLMGETDSLSNALRDFAWTSWHEGMAASVNRIVEELDAIKGDTPRFLAAMLSALDSIAEAVLGEKLRGYSDWQTKSNGATVLAYYDALKAVGYTPSDAESGLLVEVSEVVAGEDGEDHE